MGGGGAGEGGRLGRQAQYKDKFNRLRELKSEIEQARLNNISIIIITIIIILQLLLSSSSINRSINQSIDRSINQSVN